MLETALTPEEVESTVTAALKSVDGALSLTDERGRKVIVPANLVAYVEIAAGRRPPRRIRRRRLAGQGPVPAFGRHADR